MRSNNHINPLWANTTKSSNTLKQLVGKLPTNCLSVFDHFLRLVLKGLKLAQGIHFCYYMKVLLTKTNYCGKDILSQEQSTVRNFLLASLNLYSSSNVTSSCLLDEVSSMVDELTNESERPDVLLESNVKLRYFARIASLSK